MYGRSNPLISLKGHETITLSSQQGVHQGDPLGPAFFSIPLHSSFCELQTNNPLVSVLAYLDDIVILGSPEEALAAFSDLKVILPSIGLSISDAKCEVYAPSRNLPPVLVLSLSNMMASPPQHVFLLLEKGCVQS